MRNTTHPQAAAPTGRGTRSSLPNRWRQTLHDAPDLRWDKVQRVREAISNHAYDDDRILERLMDRFQDDFGVLCRRATD